MGLNINIGCGLTPTPGWLNFDNSLSVRIAKHPTFSTVVAKTPFLNAEQKNAVLQIRRSKVKIEYADASVKIPADSETVDSIYSSHMLEHLDRTQAGVFLAEVRRVLKPQGVLRLAVPDLRKIVQKYNATLDANAFVNEIHMAAEQPRTAIKKLLHLVVGFRHHLWMYDEQSLCQLLTGMDFAEAGAVPPGKTRIREPGELDLYERVDESVYVECIRP